MKRRRHPETSRARIACVVCGGPLPIEAAANRKTCSPTCLTRWRRQYLKDYMREVARPKVAADPEARRRERARWRRRAASKAIGEVRKVIDDRSDD